MSEFSPRLADDFAAIRQRMQEISDEERDPVIELLSLLSDPIGKVLDDLFWEQIDRILMSQMLAVAQYVNGKIPQ